jgi:hypothetical protein
VWCYPAWAPILNGVEFLFDIIAGLLGWLIDVVCAGFEGLVHLQAGHALAEGRVECSLKVSSGHQRGLSKRWRNGMAAISPGRLDFTPGRRPIGASGPLTISYIAVLGPARVPSTDELTWLPGDCRIAELQTPTAMLDWAVPAHDLPWALEQLQNQALPGRRSAAVAPSMAPTGTEKTPPRSE